MLSKVTLRAVSVLLLALFLLIFVDLQLRTRNINNFIYTSRLVNTIQDALTPAKGAQRATSSPRFTEANRLNRTVSVLQGRILKWKNRIRPSLPAFQLTDIFIAVKTTGRFHETRLGLLLETWITKTKEHTFIFTDREDEDLTSRGFRVVVTSCPSDHSHHALSCKMSAEYDTFMASDKRWLCHVDDDNYLNPGALLSLLASFTAQGDVYVGKPSLDHPIRALEQLEGNRTREVRFWFATGGAGFCLSRRLAEKMSPWATGRRFEHTSSLIRLPDDCTVGFIVERRLGVPLVHCPLFHSHLENLQLLRPGDIPQQVTLGYGLFENKMNSVELKGSFSREEDPSRFKTIHCLLYPFTSWCP